MLKALLVDDEKLVKVGLRNVLNWAAHGYEIAGEASNGEAALALAREIRPDVVLTDIRMPRMTGLELIRALRLEQPDVRFVVLSAYNDFDYVQQAMRMGVTEYLLKLSMDEEALVAVLGRIRAQIEADLSKREANRRIAMERRAYLIEHRSLLIRKLLARPQMHHPPSGGELSQLLGEPGMDTYALHLIVHGKERGVITAGACDTACRVEENFGGRDGADAVFYYDDSEFGVLVHPGMDIEEGRILSLCQWMAGHLRERLDAPVSIGMAGATRDLPSLAAAVTEARRAARHSFYTGMGTVNSAQSVGAYLPIVRLRAWRQLRRAAYDKQAGQAGQRILPMLEEMAESRSLEPGQVVGLCDALVAALAEGAAPAEGDAAGAEAAEPLRLPAMRYDTIGCLKDWVAQCLSMIERRQAQSYGPDIARIIQYVEENYQRAIRLSDLAGVLYKNESYISHVFKKRMGISFVDYLTQVRLTRAKAMLAEGDRTIAAIAEDVGFHDAAYFCRVFKKTTGQSPQQYHRGVQEIVRSGQYD